MEVVREVENNDFSFEYVRKKYGIKGSETVQTWVRKYGNGTKGKVIRVQRPEETDQIKQMERQVRSLEKALAETTVELSVERAYTRLACQRAGIEDVDEFKKKADGTRHIKL
ncbi:MAG: hypothetical protein K9N48_09145 [Verrucomicrobia bacterium]|nr:hypothetical protein [Verrucomicrobiota bacterium]